MWPHKDCQQQSQQSGELSLAARSSEWSSLRILLRERQFRGYHVSLPKVQNRKHRETGRYTSNVRPYACVKCKWNGRQRTESKWQRWWSSRGTYAIRVLFENVSTGRWVACCNLWHDNWQPIESVIVRLGSE